MRISKAYAQKVADRAFAKNMNFNYDWDSVRDYCDDVTYGDLDCFRLDMLTDWVLAALNKKKTMLGSEEIELTIDPRWVRLLQTKSTAD